MKNLLLGSVAEEELLIRLHAFQDRQNGWYPSVGLAMDSAGNLYGATDAAYPNKNAYQPARMILKRPPPTSWPCP